MSNMTSESKDIMMSDDCVDSPSFDEASSGGNVLGGSMLKKGPWTSAEDAILVDYVNKHGEGNWNAVQKHSGLSRCGKSCRLRWANHLRPDLKKGAFTPEEERRIIELHAKMGNKWARMAAELPGRTDNEIKNFWNTRIKRRQRAGLPIYPPDICSQALYENQQSHDMGTFSTGNTPDPENLPTFSLDIPALELECLELNPSLYYPPTFLDIASQVIDSSYSNSLLRPPIPGFFDSSEKIFGFSSSYDDSLNAYLSSSLGSHALLNGNFSSSGPVSAVSKIELPSLQYSDTQVGSWGLPSSPLPSLESVDTLIQSPPSEPTKPDSLSPQNNGLLESVLYESRTKKKSKNNSWHQYSDGSVAAGDVVDGLTQLRDSEWEVYGDPNSPLGHSATSVFSEYTPVSGSSFDDPESVDTVPAKQEAVEWDPTQYDRNGDTSNQMKFSRPDFLLGLSWFDLNPERGKDRSILADAIEQLRGKDSSSCSFKRSASSSSGQEGGRGSCEWK